MNSDWAQQKQHSFHHDIFAKSAVRIAEFPIQAGHRESKSNSSATILIFELLFSNCALRHEWWSFNPERDERTVVVCKIQFVLTQLQLTKDEASLDRNKRFDVVDQGNAGIQSWPVTFIC